jgi:cytidylate kinase
MPLTGTRGLLRVLVTGSIEQRAKRLSQEGGVTLDAAAIVANESDAARADYFRRFYGLQHENTTHYDLAVNTDVIGDNRACATIVALARAM